MGYRSLSFKNKRGGIKKIAKINDLDETGHPKSDHDILKEADSLIRVFCADRNFKIYYIRFWNRNGITIFDVGSHSEFFQLSPAIDFSHDNGGAQDG